MAYESNGSDVKKTSPALIAVAWAIVVIPTVWGFTYTVQNALKIFQPAVTAPASPAK